MASRDGGEVNGGEWKDDIEKGIRGKNKRWFIEVSWSDTDLVSIQDPCVSTYPA